MNQDIYFPGSPDVLVLAGGGNRCWWQAGLINELEKEGVVLPREIVATSAGAAIAAGVLCGVLHKAVEACQRLYAENTSIFKWQSLLRGRVEFAHQKIYPEFIRSFVNEEGLRLLREKSVSLYVAVSRPSPRVGLGCSIFLGTIAYLLDKKIWHRLHPRLPSFLGLSLDFIPLNACEEAEEAVKLLCATAAPPPILPALKINGDPAFDGGYTDNAPLRLPHAGSSVASLTLLTRYYPNKPSIFIENGRWYWQPSRPVPVSTWDCTRKTCIDAAYELGREDAKKWLSKI